MEKKQKELEEWQKGIDNKFNTKFDLEKNKSTPIIGSKKDKL